MERTVVNFSSEFDKISPTDSVLLLGSCFSANIGNSLKRHKFDAIYNPFGVLFHPSTIYNLIRRAIDNQSFEDNDFFERDNYWFSFELGANTGQESIEDAISWSNQQLELLQNYLKKSTRLILTFGTAFGFSKEGRIVGNCHKMNSNLFRKELSKKTDLEIDSFKIMDQLNTFNPNLKINLTVSPIRHVKEGLRENNLSKCTLLLLTSVLEKKYANVEYLPIYEVVLDELRDYSFYKSDLIHVNDQAIKVVWNRFSDWNMNVESVKFISEVNRISSQLNHKSLYPKSLSNIVFKKALIEQMKSHQSHFPEIWLVEIQRVKKDVDNLE
jgi:hypothetical protein